MGSRDRPGGRKAVGAGGQRGGTPSYGPYQVPGVRMVEEWIPMGDGVRLAATLYLPMEGPLRHPAILEYIPYRKDDWTLRRDLQLHPHFVRRGYAVARVDIRGTGRSEGAVPDREYSDQEQMDALEVIAWLARQPWCDGAVGMMGISWGGFNSIQVAARKPPALRAIIAIDATEDLFQDDIHYIDGLFHVDTYEVEMELQPIIPRAPDFSLDEGTMAARFDAAPWSLLYKRHQRDGPFWARASVRHRLREIRVPAFLIGGWLDGYRDSIPRMVQGLGGPVRAIVGPWNHAFPHDATPGPSIEWRGEAVAWWDRWLKGVGTGGEPRMIVYLRHWHPPGLDLETIPGEWRGLPGWPPEALAWETLHPTGGHALASASGDGGMHDLRYAPTAGSCAGFWWGDLTEDQGPWDARSLVYETPPLDQPKAILGCPTVKLLASSDAPLAHWFVRLSDISPDGAATLVTGAGLNGSHRASAEAPEPLVPNVAYRLGVDMHFTSWIFPPGHRIRLAVSNACWPMVWPTPYPMTTTLHLGGSRLLLPTIAPDGLPAIEFPPPDPPEVVPTIRSSDHGWPGKRRASRDEVRGTAIVEWEASSSTDYPWGRMVDRESAIHRAEDFHPERASFRGQAETQVHLPGRVLTWRATLAIDSDGQFFQYRLDRELLRDGNSLRSRTWTEAIPRDHQ